MGAWVVDIGWWLKSQTSFSNFFYLLGPKINKNNLHNVNLSHILIDAESLVAPGQ